MWHHPCLPETKQTKGQKDKHSKCRKKLTEYCVFIQDPSYHNNKLTDFFFMPLSNTYFTTIIQGCYLGQSIHIHITSEWRQVPKVSTKRVQIQVNQWKAIFIQPTYWLSWKLLVWSFIDLSENVVVNGSVKTCNFSSINHGKQTV